MRKKIILIVLFLIVLPIFIEMQNCADLASAAESPADSAVATEETPEMRSGGEITIFPPKDGKKITPQKPASCWEETGVDLADVSGWIFAIVREPGDKNSGAKKETTVKVVRFPKHPDTSRITISDGGFIAMQIVSRDGKTIEKRAQFRVSTIGDSTDGKEPDAHISFEKHEGSSFVQDIRVLKIGRSFRTGSAFPESLNSKGTNITIKLEKINPDFSSDFSVSLQ